MDKKNTSIPQNNDHMILLEFFVERIAFNDNIDPNLRAGRTTIDFQFLDNEPIAIEPANGVDDDELCTKAAFNMGKTCLFSLTPEQAELASSVFDLYIRVYQSRKCGVQRPNLLGIGLIPLTNIFKEILKKAGDKPSESTPGASKYIRNSVPLTDLENYPTVVGHLCASVRLNCFGKFIQTDFQMNMDYNSIDYKANEAAYRLKYHKKFEACPQKCGPTTPIPCGSPRVCGLNAPHVEPTPPPPIPPAPNNKEGGTKGKGNKGKAKGKAKGKGKGKSKKGGQGKAKKVVTPGSCKPDTSCPDSCPGVYAAMQEAKMKEAAQLAESIKTEPAFCPPSCYEKDAESHVKWNDCPLNCPSAPEPKEGDCFSCCPVNKAAEPKACPLPNLLQTGPQACPPSGPCASKQDAPCCAWSTTQPGQAFVKPMTCPKPVCAGDRGPSGTGAMPLPTQNPGTAMCASPANQTQQYAPAFYIGSTPQTQIPPSNQQPAITCRCEQKPVTMMKASEPNYSPKPPMDIFHVNMGPGGSLNARVHQETIPNKISCPVNYMPPPTANDLNRKNIGSNRIEPKVSEKSGPPCQRPRQPQIIEMRPGLDEETPFRFAVGDGAMDQNQLCVSPPTYIAKDGTKYTEISDPKKQVFVMRIGKKFEGTLGGRNNIDLHLTTPPPPLADPEVSCTFQQYNIADTPPGGEYRLGPSETTENEKPPKKGGKKGGKAGKKGKKK